MSSEHSEVRATDAGAKRSQTSWLDALMVPLPPRAALARQFDIDAVRGIAIVLVVVGHVVARDLPRDNQWYFVLKEVIYKFHMPLFMVLAGLSFALSLPKLENWRAIGRYSRDKVSRLAIPYLCFGVLILVGKIIAANYLHVDNVPKGTLDDVVELLVRPSSSAAGFLWFIYVLALYFLALPAFLQTTGRRPIILMALALVAQFVPWPQTLLLDRAFEYLPFFAGGMLLWMCRSRWCNMSLRIAVAWMAWFLLALAMAYPLNLSKWMVGALSVPALLGMVQQLSERARLQLAWIGQLSLSIYLMNTLAIGIVKALMLKIMPWDGLNFLVYFPLLTASGVALPIAVKWLSEHHAPRLNRFI